MSKNIKNSLLYLLPSLLGVVLPLISMPFFTRELQVKDYGILALCQAYAIFVNSISNFGLSISYERNFFEVDESSKIELLYANLVFVIFTYLFFGFLTYCFLVEILRFLNIPAGNSYMFIVTYFATGMTGLKSFYLIYFKNIEDAKKYVWYTIDESILGFILSIYFILYLRIGVIGMVSSQFISSCFVFSLLSWRFLRQHSFSFNWGMLKSSLVISFPLTPRLLFGIIGTQFDKYLLGSLTSLGGVGVYSIAQKIATVVFTFISAVQNVWSPNVYKLMFSNENSSHSMIGNYLSPFYYVSVLFGLIISLFSEEILFVLAPVEYHGASQIIILLSMLYCSYFFGKQNQLIFAKKTYLISIITILGILLNVSFNYVFIKHFGLYGVGWGTLLSGLLTGVFGFVISQNHYKIKWNYRVISITTFIFIFSTLFLFYLNYINTFYVYKLSYKVFSVFVFLIWGKESKIFSRNYFNIFKLYFNKIF